MDQLLQALSLERYGPALCAAGWTMQQLAISTDAQLQSLGLPLGPRRKIQAHFKRMVQSDQLCQPTNSMATAISVATALAARLPAALTATGVPTGSKVNSCQAAPAQRTRQDLPQHGVQPDEQILQSPACFGPRQTELLLLEALYQHAAPKTPWMPNVKTPALEAPASGIKGCAKRSRACNLWRSTVGNQAQQVDVESLARCHSMPPPSLSESGSMPFAELQQIVMQQWRQDVKLGAEASGHKAESLQTRVSSGGGCNAEVRHLSTGCCTGAAATCSRAHLRSRLAGLKDELRAAEQLVSSLQDMVAEAETELHQHEQQANGLSSGQEGGEVLQVADLIELLDSSDDDEKENDVLLLCSQPAS